MKITSVIIFGSKYKVIKGKIDPRFYGYVDYAKKTIYIQHRITKDLIKETLLHEMGHALFERLHIQLPSEIVEVIVDSMAKMILENFTIRKKAR